MITNNYYYGNNQNMNTGKFNGDNSQYNFTNQKPVPINQIKQKQRVYNSKPKTSSNIYRPINPQELQEARNAYTMALAEAFKGGEVSTSAITKTQVPELGDWTVTFNGTGTNATVTKTVSGTTVTYEMKDGVFAKKTTA